MLYFFYKLNCGGTQSLNSKIIIPLLYQKGKGFVFANKLYNMLFDN
jgi:hypothetical protein